MVRRKLNWRAIAIIAASTALGVGILTFYVWYQTESVKLGLDLARGEARIRELEVAIEGLELRRAKLLDPRLVEAIAREKLGLIEPADADIIYEARDPVR